MARAQLTSADATAIIDGALLGASQGKPLSESVPVVGESPVMPGPLPTDEPIVEDEKDLTPEQKKAQADQEKIAKAQQDMLGKEEADRLKEEEQKRIEREKTLIGLADKALQASKGAASGAGVRIANMPTPGDVTFPLILLVLFFFILITYAGHTRLQWLWLTLTDNAYVTDQTVGTPLAGAIAGGPSSPVVAELPVVTTGNGMYGSPFS